MAGTHLLMKIKIIPITSSMIEGITDNVGLKEMTDSLRKGMNPRYEESNVVSDKIKKCYLVLALSFRFFGNLAYRL